MAKRSPLWLLPLCVALPAYAQYSGNGLLQWSYDDVTVSAPSGRRRSAAWNQLYRYTERGPLGSSMIGDGEASATFSQGRSLAQAVSGRDDAQKVLGYAFRADLLPPGVRPYLNAAPSFARTKTTQVWGTPPVNRDLIDESRALALGLSLPRLPTLNYSRALLGRRDASSPSVVDQRTDQQSQQATYVRGSWRAQYRRDVSVVDDRINRTADSRTVATAAETDYNKTDLNAIGVRDLFWRNSYQSQRSEFAGAVTRQESYASDLYATSKRWRGRLTEGYLSYGGQFGHTGREPLDTYRNSLTLSTSGLLRRGRADNQLSVRRVDGRGRSDSANDSLTAEWRDASQKMSFRFDGGGGWSSDPVGGAALADTARQRVTYAPRPLWDGWVEGGTSGATPLGGRSGGMRQHLGGLGVDVNAAPYANFSSNYAYTRTRSLALGTVTTVNSVSASAGASPLESLKFRSTYSLNWSRVGAGAQNRHSMLTLTMTWTPADSVQVFGEVNYSDRASDEALQADYTIGLTRLSARLERVRLYTIYPYSRVNLTLTRQL